ncbi:hypothetical protein ABZ567_17190 [Streptomyces sp. NPDC016459]|uniref:hypothetical protein n=1 Tax=Streptomyces sp. NPDC016459 TaxID=3157190 RepID=UPI0033D13FBB
MSYDQPGPYGAQPQQPGPYGQQPQAPQSVPRHGYGGPRQGRPGGSDPQQSAHHDGWVLHGQVPTPPEGEGSGKRVGLIVGAVMALAVVGGGAWYFTAGGGGGATLKDDGPHRLTAPVEVLGGTYKSVVKKADEPRPLNESKAKYLAGTGISADSTSVVNVYSTSAELHEVPKADGLVFLGVHGEVKDPQRTLDAVFAAMRKRPDTTLIGDAREMSPGGLNGAVMKCQKAEPKTPTLPGHTQVGVRCVWADYSTIGVVTLSNPTAAYSMDEAAEITAALRKEVRVAGE